VKIDLCSKVHFRSPHKIKLSLIRRSNRGARWSHDVL